jgi:hypothetical protein
MDGESGSWADPFQAIVIKAQAVPILCRRRYGSRSGGPGYGYGDQSHQANAKDRRQGEQRDALPNGGAEPSGFPDQRHRILLFPVGCQENDFSCRVFRASLLNDDL